MKSFEVFAKNLDSPSDRFEPVLDSATVNENPEMDTLIPFSKQLKTDHVILRGEYEKISVAMYGKLLPPEEVSLILSKQFDMPQQAAFILKRKDEISPALSESDEKILENAKRYFELIDLGTSPSVASTMTDVDPFVAIDKSHLPPTPPAAENIETLKAKIEALCKGIMDVYSGAVTSPPPITFCSLLQDLISNVEKVSLFYMRLTVLTTHRYSN